MVRCERCNLPIVGSCGRNQNTEKVYCEVCLEAMSKDINQLATFLACKREPVSRERQRQTA